MGAAPLPVSSHLGDQAKAPNTSHVGVPVPPHPRPHLSPAPVEAGPAPRLTQGGSGAAGGGKHGAIHNLCSAPRSSCLANVKHCLGLFWALYFCKGCFGVGEGHQELFPVASASENKTPREEGSRTLLGHAHKTTVWRVPGGSGWDEQDTPEMGLSSSHDQRPPEGAHGAGVVTWGWLLPWT